MTNKKPIYKKYNYQVFIIFILFSPMLFFGWYGNLTAQESTMTIPLLPDEYFNVHRFNPQGSPITYDINNYDQINDYIINDEAVNLMYEVSPNTIDMYFLGQKYILDNKTATINFNFYYENDYIYEPDEIQFIIFYAENYWDDVRVLNNIEYRLTENVLDVTDEGFSFEWRLTNYDYLKINANNNQLYTAVIIEVDGLTYLPDIWNKAIITNTTMTKSIEYRENLIPYTVVGVGFLYVTVGIFALPFVNVDDINRRIKKWTKK